MPLYDYACTRCGRTHEVRHGFDETYDAPCEACGAPVRRVFNAAPVVFKGSGFYVTDSRRSGKAAGEKPKTETGAKAEESKPADAAKPPEKSAKTSGPAKPSESAA
ncbi:MAG: zinc ribbon domain-containing protein [Candidatus Eremiobacteraeota bacterium]|nr:zinc ribbon domain-containing protein [Candidatus Eremiobacteraeota bacterium]MBV9699652.1 zinc ribbon domain-containing protein [Candidatus Eremiobacteraeota bacterium]